MGGGDASVRIKHPGGSIDSSHTYSTGADQPSQIVLEHPGDILEFTTDPGTTITMLVGKGIENI